MMQAYGPWSRGEGALTLESGTGTCHPRDPLFRPIFCSEDPPFKPFFQLQRPHFYFLEKKCIFKPNFLRFWLNFSSWDTHFSENLFPRPQDPYFWKPGRHIPTKNYLNYLPRGPDCLNLHLLSGGKQIDYNKVCMTSKLALRLIMRFRIQCVLRAGASLLHVCNAHCAYAQCGIRFTQEFW